MQITIFTAVLAFAVGINAAAWQPTVQSYQQKCGNTGKLSCCNPSQQSAAAGGLLALLPGGSIAGGACQQVPLDAAAVPLSGASAICGGNQISCCSKTTTNQLVSKSSVPMICLPIGWAF